MTRFLRLFAAFRDLESRLMRAEAEIDAVRHEAERWRVAMLDAYHGRTEDLKASADFVARARYGFTMYDKVPELAQEPASMKPIMTGPRQASSVVKDLEQKFFHDLKAQNAESAAA